MGPKGRFSAELLHWSGIISLIGCGLVQAHYSFKNISANSCTTVKYFIKMLSSVSGRESQLFRYLGMSSNLLGPVLGCINTKFLQLNTHFAAFFKIYTNT